MKSQPKKTTTIKDMIMTTIPFFNISLGSKPYPTGIARTEVGNTKAQLEATDAIYTYGIGFRPRAWVRLMTMGTRIAQAAVSLDMLHSKMPIKTNILIVATPPPSW